MPCLRFPVWTQGSRSKSGNDLIWPRWPPARPSKCPCWRKTKKLPLPATRRAKSAWMATAPGSNRWWSICWITPSSTRRRAGRSTSMFTPAAARPFWRWWIREWEFRRARCRTFSSAFIGWTRRARATRAGPGWGWPSSSPSAPRMAARWRWKAWRGMEAGSCGTAPGNRGH